MKEFSLDFYEEDTGGTRVYKLYSGDVFTINDKLMVDVFKNSNRNVSFIPIKRYKMVKWYNPATWFKKWIDVMFVQHDE